MPTPSSSSAIGGNCAPPAHAARPAQAGSSIPSMRLDAELVGRAGLTFADALDLGRPSQKRRLR
jgi:hypothetical protein